MDLESSAAQSKERSLSVAASFGLLFFGLTLLAGPPWLSIERGNAGALLLTAAHLFPMSVWILQGGGFFRRLIALLLGAVAALSLFLHGPLTDLLVANMDAGGFWSTEVVLQLLELLLSVLSVPVGLWVVEGQKKVRLLPFIGIPAAFGALGQVLFFVLARSIQGPSGLEFWMAARVLILGASGLTAGFFTFAGAVFRPQMSISFSGGFTAFFKTRFHSLLPGVFLVTTAFVCIGILRVVVLKQDRDRFVTMRLDDYFFSLSNLTSARTHGLLYADLTQDLSKKRQSLFGAASFDAKLVARLRPMLSSVESMETGTASRNRFEERVMAVNRRLLTLGEPYFLEPYSLGYGDGRLRFVLRYRIVRNGRYGAENSPSVLMLRLRRIDDIWVDTPYTGLSFRGIGTILMDHIEMVVQKSYLPLFLPAALTPRSSDGKWAATFALIRKDAKKSLTQKLIVKDGYPSKRLQQLANEIANRAPLHVTHIREYGGAEAVGMFDRVCEWLIRQTEIHEARHASDRTFSTKEVASRLESLTVHALAIQTAAEIRAYLSEMVDGPLGPKFALATLGRLVIEPNASANAYFFASILILEGLTGEKVRRPEIMTIRKGEKTKEILMPISDRHPGWLSYSRIHGAYADLSLLSDESLRQRAMALFEALFDESYRHVERRR